MVMMLTAEAGGEGHRSEPGSSQGVGETHHWWASQDLPEGGRPGGRQIPHGPDGSHHAGPGMLCLLSNLDIDCTIPIVHLTLDCFQAKTIIQAEIDTACELADFYRFNVQWGLVSSQFTAPWNVGGKPRDWLLLAILGAVRGTAHQFWDSDEPAELS